MVEGTCPECGSKEAMLLEKVCTGGFPWQEVPVIELTFVCMDCGTKWDESLTAFSPGFAWALALDVGEVAHG